MDLEIIASLETVLAADPANLALRAHLAELLCRAGQHQRALDESRAVLQSRPDDLACLGYAASAAEALGQVEAASGYRRLRELLGGGSAGNAPPKIEPPPPEPDLDNEEPGVVQMLADSASAAEEHQAWIEETSQLKLTDVAGMESVKRRLELSFLGPLRNPEMMRAYGKTVRGGLMLYGPPGCGKTFVARAIAGELGARFLSVGIAEVLDMYLGQTERNLQAIFQAARAASPCVLFFDEIDALGRKRSLRRESAGRDLVNLLLSELDGIQSANTGVFVLAATNHPWDVDSALRRPGRLDRMLLVLPPDLPARRALLETTLRSRPQENLDLDTLAAKTDRYSGADIVHLCEAATEQALEESMKTGKVRPIRMDDFKRPLKETKPSTSAWFETARNYALFANEGGAYDELLEYLRANKFV
ncbi:MAG: AAA family ATPase [Acidobacteria bacterium]|nr:AAA family ATPase [Acidobacteriota bacterium]